MFWFTLSAPLFLISSVWLSQAVSNVTKVNGGGCPELMPATARAVSVWVATWNSPPKKGEVSRMRSTSTSSRWVFPWLSLYG